MKLKIKKVNQNCTFPKYMTPGAAAMDVFACIEQAVVINPRERVLIPTGFAIQLPHGYAALLCARSGMALKSGIALANGIGVIDSDYTGEVKVALINNTDAPFTVEKDMRIAQLMITPVMSVTLDVVDELDQTQRGNGGFGSTGTKA